MRPRTRFEWFVLFFFAALCVLAVIVGVNV